MKNFYATLSAIALGVATMAAANGLNPVNVPGNLIQWDGQQNFETKMLRSDISKATKAPKHKAARVEAEEEEITVCGDYVSVYMPIFTNYLEQEMTDVVTIEEDGEGAYNLKNLAGWHLEDWIDAVKADALVKGTYEDGVITVELGQVLGSYAGYDLVLAMFDDEDNLYIAGESYITYVDGAWEADGAYMVIMLDGENLGGYFSGTGTPLLLPATATATYEVSSSNGDRSIEMPVYYEFVDNEDGTESLVMSNLNWATEGYLFELPVNPETNRAVARDIVAYSNKNSQSDYTYLYCMLGNVYYTSQMVIGVADRNKLAFPAEGLYFDLRDDEEQELTEETMDRIDQWMVYDPDMGSYFGDCTRCYITAIGYTDGIENVVVDNSNTDAAPVYYNLQGVRVNNPANGIFIVKKGNSASKVLVK